MELHGRVALVTGGAKRIGREIALALARRGAGVGITYRASAAEAVETLREFRELGSAAVAVQCDQRDPEQIQGAARYVEAELGPVDVLVNNAAIFHRTPFAEATLEDWDEHLETNLRGPWLWAKALAPGMQARGEGVILNLIDIAAERPYPGYLPYTASKAGLVALTRGLARALAPQVRVNGIAPGVVLMPDEFPEAQAETLIKRTPLRREGSPADIAATALYLIEGSDFITGVIAPVDGGLRLV